MKTKQASNVVSISEAVETHNKAMSEETTKKQRAEISPQKQARLDSLDKLFRYYKLDNIKNIAGLIDCIPGGTQLNELAEAAKANNYKVLIKFVEKQPVTSDVEVP